MAQEHVALVTGGGSGIGAAIAERAARAGATVLVAARGPERCAEVAQRIARKGGRAHALPLDVTDAASVRAALGRAADLAPAVDWLVNSAGIALSAPLLARGEGGEDLYERHLDVNFHGSRRMVEAVLPKMREGAYGRIVHVASSAGLRGYRYVAAYCASKHALVGYTRSAALELAGCGVSMAAVCPHFVDSPMTAESIRRVSERTGRATADVTAEFAAQNPGGRLVAPSEVAEAALELLLEERNGWIVELDGRGARVLERGPA